MEKQILWSVNQGIGLFTFNRPGQANSFGLESCAEMIEGVNRMAEPDVRVVVITGQGDFFNTGGNVDEFIENLECLDQRIEKILQSLHPMIHKLASLPIPIISAVNGPLSGAGIAYALCADFVLASDSVKLRGGYCGIALSPDMGASYFLTRRVGAAKAKEIFMLNRGLSADDCLRLGIVDHVYPKDKFKSAVDTLAQSLAKGPTSSYGSIKALCDKAFSHNLELHLDLERELLVRNAASTDCKEGIAAFIEKRAPSFVGS